MLYDKVETYLNRTNQSQALAEFDGYDIRKMMDYADSLQLKPVVKSEVIEAGQLETAHNTVDLGRDLEAELREVINNLTAEDIELELTEREME
jgi:hypothetical protein